MVDETTKHGSQMLSKERHVLLEGVPCLESMGMKDRLRLGLGTIIEDRLPRDLGTTIKDSMTRHLDTTTQDRTTRHLDTTSPMISIDVKPG
jgi:hypothetical protein